MRTGSVWERAVTPARLTTAIGLARRFARSLATFVSRTILPDESTTQTLLSFSDTSIPA